MNILNLIEARVVLSGDSETRRSQKTISTTLLFVGGLFTMFSAVISLAFGLATSGLIYAVWAVIEVTAAAAILFLPPLWFPLMSGIILGIMPMALFTHLYSGGFQSGVIAAVWMLLAPIAASLFIGSRFAILTLLTNVLGIIIAAFLEPFARSVAPEIAETNLVQIAAINLIMMGLVATAAALYLLRQVDYYRQRADDLLLNILPAPIAARLKESSETIADGCSDVTVLFADIVGSTPLFSELEPAEAVSWLNEAFTMFDHLVDHYGLEKIRTIGDNYMVASGVPIPRADHARAMTLFALDMLRGLEGLPPRHGKRLAFRVGINSGPLVAGVIGRSKFQYDLWGDTVNTASRMESHGEAGRVHISAATHALIKDDFDCLSRGFIQIKGKGDMETWFVLGPKSTVPMSVV